MEPSLSPFQNHVEGYVKLIESLESIGNMHMDSSFSTNSLKFGIARSDNVVAETVRGLWRVKQDQLNLVKDLYNKNLQNFKTDLSKLQTNPDYFTSDQMLYLHKVGSTLKKALVQSSLGIRNLRSEFRSNPGALTTQNKVKEFINFTESLPFAENLEFDQMIASFDYNFITMRLQSLRQFIRHLDVLSKEDPFPTPLSFKKLLYVNEAWFREYEASPELQKSIEACKERIIKSYTVEDTITTLTDIENKIQKYASRKRVAPGLNDLPADVMGLITEHVKAKVAKDIPNKYGVMMGGLPFINNEQKRELKKLRLISKRWNAFEIGKKINWLNKNFKKIPVNVLLVGRDLENVLRNYGKQLNAANFTFTIFKLVKDQFYFFSKDGRKKEIETEVKENIVNLINTHLTKLDTLMLEDVEEKQLHALKNRLFNLRELILEGDFTSIGSFPLHELPLERLELIDVGMPMLPINPKLKVLKLNQCYNLKALGALHEGLEELEIRKCDRLAFPNLPKSLKKLTIEIKNTHPNLEGWRREAEAFAKEHPSLDLSFVIYEVPIEELHEGEH